MRSPRRGRAGTPRSAPSKHSAERSGRVTRPGVRDAVPRGKKSEETGPRGPLLTSKQSTFTSDLGSFKVTSIFSNRDSKLSPVDMFPEVKSFPYSRAK